MYYFIPSWYGRQLNWHAEDAPWYRADNAYEFDDTVNQVRMFRQAGEETTLITLSYAPQLHYFLHRQSIYPIAVLSAFDRMQHIPPTIPGLFNYMDLPWPGTVEWVYTPYTVLAYLHGREYARIEFGEDGNLLWIDYFDAAQRPDHRDYYDDRGFRSSRMFFLETEALRQEYYDPSGTLQFTENLQNGLVTIAPGAAFDFHRRIYGSMAEVLAEVLTGILEDIPAGEVVIVASDARHNALIWQAAQAAAGTRERQAEKREDEEGSAGGETQAETRTAAADSGSGGAARNRSATGYRIVLSYFENRFDLRDTGGLERDTAKADFVVTDTGGTAKQIRSVIGDRTRVEDISPFDTRLSLGKSQRIRELKIFMPVDDFEGVFFEKALVQVCDYMRRNAQVQLLVGTRQLDDEKIAATRGRVQEALNRYGYRDLKFDERIFMQPFLSENDLIRILENTRLILDVRDQPDLYLQIAGISAGIPQVNYRFTRYVDHKKDGYIIQNINYVGEALDYYLSGLSHWNEALMYCVQKTESYTGGNLVRMWKEQLTGEPDGTAGQAE